MKRKFIINPRSGKRIAGIALGELEAFFIRHTGAFDYALAENRETAVRITRRTLHEGARQIVAVGGDGTVNAVVNGFFEEGKPIRPECSLAVARTGTGSDYFRTLVAGRKSYDWKRLVLQHAVRSVDVGRIRFADPDQGDRLFVNMASVGLVADVVEKKNRARRRLPTILRYIVPTLASLLAYRATPVRLSIDGTQRDTELLTATISKGVYAGGGMKFGGSVTLFDGLLDVTVMDRMGRLEMLRKLPKLYSGRLQGERKIHKFKARRVSVRAASPMPVEFDGEMSGVTDIDVSVEEGAIRLCLPEDVASG